MKKMTKLEIVSELLRLKPALSKKRSYLFSLHLYELNTMLEKVKKEKNND